MWWILLWFVVGLVGALFVAIFNDLHETKTISFNVFAIMCMVTLFGPIGFFISFIILACDWFEDNGHYTMFDWNKKDVD